MQGTVLPVTNQLICQAKCDSIPCTETTSHFELPNLVPFQSYVQTPPIKLDWITHDPSVSMQLGNSICPPSQDRQAIASLATLLSFSKRSPPERKWILLLHHSPSQEWHCSFGCFQLQLKAPLVINADLNTAVTPVPVHCQNRYKRKVLLTNVPFYAYSTVQINKNPRYFMDENGLFKGHQANEW